MPPNRFNNIYDNTYVSTHIPLPFNELVQLGALKQQRQDEAISEKEQFLAKSWNRLPGDADRSRELKDQSNKILESFSDKDFNDPQTRADWYKARVRIADNWGSNGEIGQQEANYDSYKAYEKEIMSKSKELGWSQDELQSHLAQAKNSFQTKNDDGTLNQFQGKGLPNRVDANKWASDALKDVADDTGITQLRKYGSLNEVTDAFAHGEINHKDYNKIMNSLAMRAEGDPALKASLEQEGAFRGQQGWSKFIKGQDKEGNIIPDSSTPFGKILSGVAQGAQFQKRKEEYIKAMDPMLLWQLKRQAKEQDAQKEMQFSIQGIPADPNNPTNNDAGINLAMKSGGNPMAGHWEFKDGKLAMKNQDTKTKQVVEINGKEYDLDNLPKGYTTESSPGIYMAGAGSGMSPGTLYVKGPDNKSIGIKDKAIGSEDTLNAFHELYTIASRLGVTGDRETVTKAVEDYYLTANNFQMNFPKYDEGTIGAVSKALGVSMKTNAAGDAVITNPGQLAFNTMKTLDGKPINEKNLPAGNATRLNGAKILGPAQSLTNTNYEPGDMYVQSTDGTVYIMNSNNKTINDALAPTTKLTQSINNYVTTGKKSLDPTDEKKLNEIFPGDRIVGSVVDKHGNHYYSYVNNKDGKLEMGAIKVDTKGIPVPMGLDEATKQISETNMREILPTYDSKNFDRAFKATDLDTEDNSEE